MSSGPYPRNISKERQVFVSQCVNNSFIRPHGPISKATIARWCKSFLEATGIDTTKFHCHSTRAASASYVADANVNISSILEAVGWSNEQTFQKFYHKPCAGTSFNLGSPVLDTYVHQR